MSIGNIKHNYLLDKSYGGGGRVVWGLLPVTNMESKFLTFLFAGIITIYIKSLSTCSEFKTRIFCIYVHL